jgi:hypothetical protein
MPLAAAAAEAPRDAAAKVTAAAIIPAVVAAVPIVIFALEPLVSISYQASPFFWPTQIERQKWPHAADAALAATVAVSVLY